MPSIQKAASIYAQMQSSGSQTSNHTLHKDHKDPDKRTRPFKEVLKDEISKRK